MDNPNIAYIIYVLSLFLFLFGLLSSLTISSIMKSGMKIFCKNYQLLIIFYILISRNRADIPGLFVSSVNYCLHN